MRSNIEMDGYSGIVAAGSVRWVGKLHCESHTLSCVARIFSSNKCILCALQRALYKPHTHTPPLLHTLNSHGCIRVSFSIRPLWPAQMYAGTVTGNCRATSLEGWRRHCAMVLFGRMLQTICCLMLRYGIWCVPFIVLFSRNICTIFIWPFFLRLVSHSIWLVQCMRYSFVAFFFLLAACIRHKLVCWRSCML